MTSDSGLDLGSAPVRAVAHAAGESSALPALNLLIDFEEAASRLRAHLPRVRSREDVFDAFLLGAGLHQILEDHLHRDVRSLGKVAKHVPKVVGQRIGRPSAAAAQVLRRVGLAGRARSRSERGLIHWQGELGDFVERLADAVVAGAAEMNELAGGGAEVLARVERFPIGLRRSVIRLPHCFRSFDQRPQDLQRMVGSFAERRPDRTTPLLVVGLRTAGSYLAPLTAGYLRSAGYQDVDVLTLRPGQDWLEHELDVLGRAIRLGALVLVVDEPPRTGVQFVQAARQLEEAGVPKQSLTLLVPLFGAQLPRPFGGYETVELAWSDWAVHEQLEEDSVREMLTALLGGSAVESVERVFPATLPQLPRRGHVIAVYRVEVTDESSGEHAQNDVCVEGVGLGYLGRHASAVAAPLAGFLPDVYGTRNGLLYRVWLPQEWQLTLDRATADGALASRMAAYVRARNRALAVVEDVSPRLVGRAPAWELVADMFGDAFGRARLVVRPIVHRAARRLLAPAHPSVVDASMTLARWFAPEGAPEAALKVDFASRAFSNADHTCYDPVYDVASAAADVGPEFADALRRAYESLSGERVSDDRWLLYQLLHCSLEQRIARAESDVPRMLTSERVMARIYQRYIGDRFFADVEPSSSGPLCAIDVDWVLEVRWLSIPAMSPAAALALRALARHGYRPLLATGRSLGEVRDRCAAYRLAGGVAEYGAVVYDHLSNSVRVLLSPDEKADLDEVRRVLGELPGVCVDPAHRYGVRAYRLVRGDKAGLEPETIEAALARTSAGARLKPVQARSQTDFLHVHVDKGRGVLALAHELGAEKIAVAVGDSAPDIPMFALAERAAAPANVDATVRQLIASGDARIELASRPCGAGLLEIVSGLLGHRPGSCPVCALPQRSSGRDELVLGLLGALDGGAREKAWQAVRLAGRVLFVRA